jgi:ATP-binding cassette subfamily B protein
MVEDFNIKTQTLDFFRNKKAYVLLYIILSLSYPLGSIIVPHYYGKLIDLIVNKGNLTTTAIQTMGIWLTSISGIYGLTKIDNIIMPEFRSYLYTNIAKFVFNTYKESYTNIKIGELISKLSKLPFLILEIFYQVRTNYLPLFYMSTFSVIYFFNINKTLGAIILGVLLLFGITAAFSVKSCMPSCVSSESSNDSSNEDLQDILENILNVYTSDNIDEEIKEFNLKDRETTKHFKSCLSCSSKYKFAFSVLFLVSFFIVAKFVYLLFQQNKITLSQINSIFLVLIYLLSQVDGTLQYAQDTITYMGSVIDIQNYIQQINVSSQKTNEHISSMNENLHMGDISRLDGRIEFKNLDICFNKDGKEICVLKDFSYVIEPKTKLAIVGPVGKGKSSLLKMLLKLVYPKQGEILLDGKNLPYNVIRKHVSYIPQNPLLFNRTLYKNIIYGTNKTKEDIVKVMKMYNIEGIFGTHSLDDDVGKGGTNLSGGQKQMVILLRAILKNSSVILLDEPTTALDKDVRDTTMRLIFEVFQHSTVLMITHDPDIIPRFGKVLDLDKFT